VAELGLQPWGSSIAELTDAAVRAERAGFSSLWTSELHRSAFVHTTAVTAATSTATVATGIALAFTRSPLELALTALDLADLSDGRFVLGLGSGVRRLNVDWHGVDVVRPVQRLRAVVEAVRTMIDSLPEGRVVELDAPTAIRIRNFRRDYAPAATTVPIYLASVGPNMTELAGAVGDGWIGHQLMSVDYLDEHILPALKRGREGSGAASRPFTTVLSVCCVPHHDAELARRWAAGVVAFYASVRTYQPFFAALGFDTEALAIQTAHRDGDTPAMLAACPPELVDAVTVCGTPDDVRARVAELGDRVDVVKLAPPSHLVDHSITRAVQRSIIETFAA